MLRTKLFPLLASLLLIPACSDDSTTPGAGGTGTTTSTSSAGGAGGTGGAGTTGSTSSTGSTGGSMSKSLEEQVSDKVEAVRSKHDELQKLLLQMPKGADLHNHTSGAISMESLIKWGCGGRRLCRYDNLVRLGGAVQGRLRAHLGRPHRPDSL